MTTRLRQSDFGVRIAQGSMAPKSLPERQSRCFQTCCDANQAECAAQRSTGCRAIGTGAFSAWGGRLALLAFPAPRSSDLSMAAESLPEPRVTGLVPRCAAHSAWSASHGAG